jgi:hypothetical protein
VIKFRLRRNLHFLEVRAFNSIVWIQDHWTSLKTNTPGVITVKYVIRDPITKAVITSSVAKSTAEGFVVELPETITNLLNPFTVYEILVIAYSSEVTLPVEKGSLLSQLVLLLRLMVLLLLLRSLVRVWLLFRLIC